MRSPRTSISRSRTRRSTRSGSRARTRSRSTVSCRGPRSTTATSTSPYYIAPTDKVGQEAFSVIRDAMAEKKMVGLARVVLYRREHVVMLEPSRRASRRPRCVTPMRCAAPRRYFEDIPDLKLPAEMRKLAAHIVETKEAHFEPEKFQDHYENASMELLRRKKAGMPVEPVVEEPDHPSGHQSDGRAEGEHQRRRQEARGGVHRYPPDDREEKIRARLIGPRIIQASVIGSCKSLRPHPEEAALARPSRRMARGNAFAVWPPFETHGLRPCSSGRGPNV